MRTHTRISLLLAMAVATASFPVFAQPGTGPISGGGGGGGGAPTTVDFLVKTASGDLSAERVCTDSGTATWDFATAGQAKLTVVDLSCTNCIGGTEIDESTLSGLIGGSTGATDNAVLAADGTGGATLQTRAITISDVAGFIVTLASTPGNALALVATPPAATTGASQAGKAASLTASDAVASLDTAGAAAGGPVTITAGAAARNTSGNANGGNINLVTGAGIGTGTAGQVVVPDGTAAKPSIVGLSDSITGFSFAADDLKLNIHGQNMVDFNFGGTLFTNNMAALAASGVTKLYGFLTNVEANTAGVGSPNVILDNEGMKFFTNEGSTAMQYNTLVTAATGRSFTACVQDSDGMRITASAGDTIRRGASVTTVAGYIESTTIGSCIHGTAINATEWFLDSTNDVAADSWSFN